MYLAVIFAGLLLNSIKYIIEFNREMGLTLRQSMMLPFVSFSTDFHGPFKSGIRFQETEIAIPHAVLILGKIDQVSDDKATSIGGKLIPPLY